MSVAAVSNVKMRLKPKADRVKIEHFSEDNYTADMGHFRPTTVTYIRFNIIFPDYILQTRSLQ